MINRYQQQARNAIYPYYHIKWFDFAWFGRTTTSTDFRDYFDNAPVRVL
jgi:hypothetical protein